MRRWLPIATVVVLVLAFGPAGAAQENAAAAFAPCSDCHDTQVNDFLANPHARDFLVTRGTDGAAVCATCHGDGSKHAEEGGAKEFITYPRGAAGAAACQKCHGGEREQRAARHGAHASAAVGCEACHTVHQAKPARAQLLKTGSTALCASCHPDQRGSFRRPYGHNLEQFGEAGMTCVSCHNPHGAGGKASLKVSDVGAGPCASCHADKTGPYVFTHVTGLTGDCLSCHEPHGSTNPKALTRPRIDQLCLECHTGLQAGTIGSQPPSLHDLRNPRYTNCTTCHVAVHGSNSSPLLLK